jgi:hypothetical protein
MTAGVLLAAPPVRAKDTFTHTHSFASIGFRRGLALAKGKPTPWAYGLGGRIGLTLRGGIYVGLAADSYLFDRGVEHYPGTQSLTIHGKVGVATIDMGYDWALHKRFALRSTVGAGPAWGPLRLCRPGDPEEDEPDMVCHSGRNPRVALTTGLTLLVQLTRRVHAAGSALWLVDTGFEDRTTGALLGLDIGWRF